MNQSFTQSIKSKDSNLALYSCTVYLCKFAQILHIVLSCSDKSLSCSNKSVPIWTFCVFNLVQCAIMTLLGKMCEEEKKEFQRKKNSSNSRKQANQQNPSDLPRSLCVRISWCWIRTGARCSSLWIMVTVWASASTYQTPLAVGMCSVSPTSITVLPLTGLMSTCTRLVTVLSCLPLIVPCEQCSACDCTACSC